MIWHGFKRITLTENRLGHWKHGDKLGGYWSCVVYSSLHRKVVLVVFIEIRKTAREVSLERSAVCAMKNGRELCP